MLRSAESRRATRFRGPLHRALVSRRSRRGAGRDRRERHGQDHAAADARRAVRARRRGDPLERRARRRRFDPALRASARVRRPPARAQGRAHRRGEPRVAGRARRRVGRPPKRSAMRSTRSRSRRQRALPARVLSQGQRRRIGLARLSLLRRPLWILDEPVDRARRRRHRAAARILARPSRQAAASRSPPRTRRSASRRRACRPLALG